MIPPAREMPHTGNRDCDLPDVEVLRAEILRRLRTGRLRIPSLPDVALRVRDAVNDPDRSVADVARLVQVDPALAARLVHIANSPLYRGEKRIDSCHMAVSRLGLNATRNFVVGFTLRNLFRPKQRVLLALLQRIWCFGCRVGAISAVLARVTPGVDADRVILAGLVHGIGALPVLEFLDREEPLAASSIEGLVRALQGEMGRLVLQAWEFEEEIACIPVEIDRFRQVAPDDPAEGAPACTDVVQVAYVHALFGETPGYQGPPLPELASYRRLPISRLGSEASLEVLEQSREEIRELLQILG